MSNVGTTRISEPNLAAGTILFIAAVVVASVMAAAAECPSFCLPSPSVALASPSEGRGGKICAVPYDGESAEVHAVLVMDADGNWVEFRDQQEKVIQFRGTSGDVSVGELVSKMRERIDDSDARYFIRHLPSASIFDIPGDGKPFPVDDGTYVVWTDRGYGVVDVAGRTVEWTDGDYRPEVTTMLVTGGLSDPDSVTIGAGEEMDFLAEVERPHDLSGWDSYPLTLRIGCNLQLYVVPDTIRVLVGDEEIPHEEATTTEGEIEASVDVPTDSVADKVSLRCRIGAEMGMGPGARSVAFAMVYPSFHDEGETKEVKAAGAHVLSFGIDAMTVDEQAQSRDEKSSTWRSSGGVPFIFGRLSERANRFLWWDGESFSAEPDDAKALTAGVNGALPLPSSLASGTYMLREVVDADDEPDGAEAEPREAKVTIRYAGRKLSVEVSGDCMLAETDKQLVKIVIPVATDGAAGEVVDEERPAGAAGRYGAIPLPGITGIVASIGASIAIVLFVAVKARVTGRGATEDGVRQANPTGDERSQ